MDAEQLHPSNGKISQLETNSAQANKIKEHCRWTITENYQYI